MEKLKRCPFCGGFAGVIKDIYGTHYMIHCNNCDAKTKPLEIEKRRNMVEVVHGAWIKSKDPMSMYITCSACGTKTIGRSNYCSACGAKMDGAV